MKVAIAGAGAVGRSIARERLSSAHEVTLFERLAAHIDTTARYIHLAPTHVKAEFDAARAGQRANT